MYISTKELQELLQALNTIDNIVNTLNNKRVIQNKKSKTFMAIKRINNKNYGNHYTYRDGRKR